MQDNWWQIQRELSNWHKSYVILHVASKGKTLNSIDEILQVDIEALPVEVIDSLEKSF
jgi:hypothetical protein